MSGISDGDKIQILTNTLTSLNGLPFISLRIWYEDCQLKFFFSNLPPRKDRKPAEQLMVNQKMMEKDPSLDKPGPSPVKTRGRGKKRQCASTPENQFPPPDQLRRGSSASTSLQMSELDLPRESVCEESVNSVSIPVSNQFEVLKTLVDLDQDAEDACDAGGQSDLPPQCPRCTRSLRSISALPSFPASPTGVQAYTCGHREFEIPTFVCDGCRVIMCEFCLQNDSFICSMKCEETDQKLRDMI